MAGKGKPKPIETVRAIFAKDGKNGLWKWGIAPKEAQEKAHRFRILEIFAQRQRDASKGEEREDWAATRKVYAGERDKWERKAEQAKFNASPGAPHWGGARDFFDVFIYPLASKMAMGADYDDKEFGHAPGGDHDPTVTVAFAEDFPTFSGAAFANAIGKKFGRSSSVGTYDFITYKWQGYTWRIQILWAVEGHFNHVHIGVRRV